MLGFLINHLHSMVLEMIQRLIKCLKQKQVWGPSMSGDPPSLGTPLPSLVWGPPVLQPLVETSDIAADFSKRIHILLNGCPDLLPIPSKYSLLGARLAELTRAQKWCLEP